MAIGLRVATETDLATWDARAVDGPGGSIWQSRAWADHAGRAGWEVRHLAYDDGLPLLVLRRSWPLLPGGSAYLPRGPVAAGEPAARTAERLVAASDRLAAEGVDVVASDAEIPADSGYPALLAATGFRPIDDIHPSRHRMGAPLGTGAAGEVAAWEGIAKKTRQRIGSARRRGLVVRRFDARIAPAAEAAPSDRGDRTPAGGAVADDGHLAAAPAGILETAAAAALGPFHALLEDTGSRRGFAIGSREGSVAWWLAAMRAGHLVYLEVREVPPTWDPGAPDGALLGGAIFFRQGDRLTYGHSGDRAELRADHPGVVHLILWEAMRIAIAEGRGELDLGGVDVAGARGIPAPGDPMRGLYEFKEAFGGRWIELTGAHERVARPRRYAAGRAAGAAARALGRRGGG
jgi:hypothetical protein